MNHDLNARFPRPKVGGPRELVKIFVFTFLAAILLAAAAFPLLREYAAILTLKASAEQEQKEEVSHATRRWDL